LVKGEEISIRCFSAAGMLITHEIKSYFQAGNHDVTLAVGGFPHGVYFIQLSTKGLRQTGRLLVFE